MRSAARWLIGLPLSGDDASESEDGDDRSTATTSTTSSSSASSREREGGSSVADGAAGGDCCTAAPVCPSSSSSSSSSSSPAAAHRTGSVLLDVLGMLLFVPADGEQSAAVRGAGGEDSPTAAGAPPRGRGTDPAAPSTPRRHPFTAADYIPDASRRLWRFSAARAEEDGGAAHHHRQMSSSSSGDNRCRHGDDDGSDDDDDGEAQRLSAGRWEGASAPPVAELASALARPLSSCAARDMARHSGSKDAFVETYLDGVEAAPPEVEAALRAPHRSPLATTTTTTTASPARRTFDSPSEEGAGDDDEAAAAAMSAAAEAALIDLQRHYRAMTAEAEEDRPPDGCFAPPTAATIPMSVVLDRPHAEGGGAAGGEATPGVSLWGMRRWEYVQAVRAQQQRLAAMQLLDSTRGGTENHENKDGSCRPSSGGCDAPLAATGPSRVEGEGEGATTDAATAAAPSSMATVVEVGRTRSPPTAHPPPPPQHTTYHDDAPPLTFTIESSGFYEAVGIVMDESGEGEGSGAPEPPVQPLLAFVSSTPSPAMGMMAGGDDDGTDLPPAALTKEQAERLKATFFSAMLE